MKVLTKELTGPALSWAVAKAEGYVLDCDEGPEISGLPQSSWGWDPSTKWQQGGPIIEREHISLSHFMADPMHTEPYVIAAVSSDYATQDSRWCAGPTALVAAMRCYVVNKLGETVDIPEELM